MTTLPDFRLETHFSRWEFTAKFNMAASDAQTVSMRDLLALAQPAEHEAWESMALGYTETWGAPALREAIARTYENIEPRQVLCFAGAEEGLYCAMLALLGRDDHAIVTVPNYQSMETVPASICGEISGWRLRAENGWQPDLDELRGLLRPNTRLVAVNFPNNPTGEIADPATFRALAELCDERGIHLFSDEVYRGLERDPSRRLPQAADLLDRGVSLNVMSKAYGLPGLRVGWIATRDVELLARMERMKHYLSICNAGPSEVLTRIALGASDALLSRNLDLCTRNLAALDAFFAERPDLYQWQAPAGGCVGFARYLGPDGVEAHCRDLVERAGVLLLPASLFRSPLAAVPEDRFRVGYGREGIGEGLDAWRQALEKQGPGDK